MDMVHPGRSVRAVLLDFLKLRQTNRLLRLDFPRNDAPPDTLLVANRLHALEALSRDFVYTVEVLSDCPDIPLKSLMAKMATVSLTREDGSTRYFNGYVSTFRFVKNDNGFCFYEMTLTPWLVFLRHRRNSWQRHLPLAQPSPENWMSKPRRDTTTSSTSRSRR